MFSFGSGVKNLERCMAWEGVLYVLGWLYNLVVFFFSLVVDIPPLTSRVFKVGVYMYVWISEDMGTL